MLPADVGVGDGGQVGGGAAGDGLLAGADQQLDNPELRRMRDGVASSVVKLKTYLNLYKPSKYSPEICRAKEEVWTDNNEKALLDLNEHTFRLKDFDEKYDQDRTIAEMTGAVSEFTLEINLRAMFISEPSSQVPNQSLN